MATLGKGADVHTYSHTQRIPPKRIIMIESIGGRPLDAKFSEKEKGNLINTMVDSNVSGVSIFQPVLRSQL
jgi:hypothetical protein